MNNGSEDENDLGMILAMACNAAGMSDQQLISELPMVITEMKREIEYLESLLPDIDPE